MIKTLLRKAVLGAASVIALGIGGAALDYAADAGNTVNAASRPPASLPSQTWLHDDVFRKDNIRWAQTELRFRGLYRGSLDGLLGPQTKWALARFQERNGLSQTAALDAQTWDALTSASSVGLGSSTAPNIGEANSLTKSGDSDLGR
jgi:peptidoglycan hydrolase-like protein with peptidoglycan-binding domain